MVQSGPCLAPFECRESLPVGEFASQGGRQVAKADGPDAPTSKPRGAPFVHGWTNRVGNVTDFGVPGHTAQDASGSFALQSERGALCPEEGSPWLSSPVCLEPFGSAGVKFSKRGLGLVCPAKSEQQVRAIGQVEGQRRVVVLAPVDGFRLQAKPECLRILPEGCQHAREVG